MHPREIRLSIRNVELAAIRWPAKSNARILALHGWLDNAQSFAPLAEKMPGHDFVALDFAGHGYSGHRPAGEILHYMDYIADVYAVLKALGWETCILIGHSMGAGVASVFASAFPESVRGLICLDGLGPVTGQEEEAVPRLRKSVRSNLEPLTRNRTVYETVAQAVKARLQASDLSELSAKKLVDRNLVHINNGYVWRSDPRLRLPSLYYLSEPQVNAYLREIQAPTLMVRPTGSAYKAEKVLRARAELINDITWVDVPGGHHAHMDRAEQVLSPLNNFVEKLMADANTA